MAKLTLSDVQNFSNESTVVTQLKQNNDATELAMENTLSRDGTSPNQMLSNLDMNNYKIINLPDAATSQEPVTLSQLEATVAGVVVDASYITATSNPTLANERVLTGSSNVSITDQGPNNPIVVDVITGVNIQPHDSDLDALANTATTGLYTVTGTGTSATRSIVQPAAGITVTNGDGVAGNPTLALANDLAALEALSGTGLAAHTGTSTWTERSIVQPAAGITVTNGNGVSGNPTLALANDLSALEGLSSTGIARRTGTDAWSVGTAVSNAELQNSAITIGSTSVALGATLSAATGRGPSGLNIDELTGKGDTNYTILNTDQVVATNAAFTAPRTWTLPAANTLNAGQSIVIADLQSTLGAVNTLTISRGGSDTITAGSSGLTTVVLNTAGTSVQLISDGTSKWYAVQSGSGGGAGGAVAPGQYEYVATASQSTFSGADQNGKTLSYTVGNIEVFYNGLRLNKSDYTATTTTSVVLSGSITARAGDLITIMDFGNVGGASSFKTYEYNASAAQTTFSGSDVNGAILGYQVGFILVYVNGDLLNTADYTASNGTSVVLAARALNDQVKIVSMNQSAVALVPNNNLSDVSSASTSRVNLGAVGVVKKQIFTSSGTYTPSANLLYAIIECVGGGGGGGGVAGATSAYNGGGGGGGGTYSRLIASAATIGASQVATIGTAGTAGSAGSNNGGAGGTTSIGSICTAPGGSGGTGANGAASFAPGGAGGSTGTGDISVPGGRGGTGAYVNAVPSFVAVTNNGGTSGLCFGAGGVTTQPAGGATSVGTSGSQYGGGGSGAIFSNVAANAAGGAGAAGVIFITEYCAA